MQAAHPKPHSGHYPWQTLLHWLWLAGLIAFGLFWAWDSGQLLIMLQTDRTWISLLILILFLATSLHCGWRSAFLSMQTLALEQFHQTGSSKPSRFDQITPLLQQLSTSHDPYDRQTSAELLGEQLRGSHHTGWFITATLIKLGLLGTVIGFVLMLASVGKLESLDIDQLQSMMQQMTQGMGIALNTTLMGLIGSMLLGVQYLFLDRSADKLLASAVRLSQTDTASLTQADNTHGAV